MKVLLISLFNPLEPNTGASLRSRSLLLCLKDLGYDIHLYTFSNDTHVDNSSKELASKIHIESKVKNKRSYFIYIKSLLTLKPLPVYQYASCVAVKNFKNFVDGERYDVIICDYLYACHFSTYIKLHCSRILYQHNAEYVMALENVKNRDRLLNRVLGYMNVVLIRLYEEKWQRKCDITAHVTRSDADKYSNAASQNVVIIPNTLPYKQDFKAKAIAGNNILFIGAMTHFPNTEGILDFIENTWIKLFSIRKDINLLIAGHNPPLTISNYDDRYNIRVLGFVADIAKLYSSVKIAITPIKIASGTRLKIIESIMYSTLNMSTTKGEEGLDLIDGKEIVIADTTQEWIYNIQHYIDNRSERTAIERRAYDVIIDKYYYKHIAIKIKNMFLQIHERS